MKGCKLDGGHETSERGVRPEDETEPLYDVGAAAAALGVGWPMVELEVEMRVERGAEEEVVVEDATWLLLRGKIVAPGAACAMPRRLCAIHGWRIACSGLMRRSGSQWRHLETKSTNSSSLQCRTCCSVLVEGLRRLPFELTTGLGAPVESKKSFLRELRSTRYLSGIPNTSMMQASCSCSFSPGKIG